LNLFYTYFEIVSGGMLARCCKFIDQMILFSPFNFSWFLRHDPSLPNQATRPKSVGSGRHTQFCEVRTQDPRELGLDTWSKRFGSGRMTQEIWARTHDPLEMDPDTGFNRNGYGAWPKRLGSRCMTHSANGSVGLGSGPKRIGSVSGSMRLWFWHTTQESWAQTTDKRELGPDDWLKRIGSGCMIQEWWVWTQDPSNLGPPPDPGDLVLVRTHKNLGPPPDPRHLVLIWTQECWVRTHDPKELVPCPDPRELGLDAWPNRSGSDAWPKRVGWGALQNPILILF